MSGPGAPLSVVDVLLRTERFLRERGVESPRLEAELLLSHVLELPRLQLYLQHDRPLSAPQTESLRGLVARRGKREPLAWVLGSAGFHAIDLDTDRDVLVPRPDTEALVDALLEQLPPPSDALIYVADIGCGTGAVGLAIATARPDVRVYATDISPAALALAKRNVVKLGLDKRVAVLEGDLLSPIPEARPLDWVVSNPPYIPSADIAGLMPEVSKWEPRLALDGGADGLDVYRRLIPEATRRARHGVLVEVGFGQHGQVADLLRRARWPTVRTWRDLPGVDRVVGGLRPAGP